VETVFSHMKHDQGCYFTALNCWCYCW